MNETATLVPAPKCRITATITFHHENREDQPHTFQCGFSRPVLSEEECYTRRQTADEESKPFDLGWLESDHVSYVIVENLHGRNPQVNPSEEDKVEVSKHILEIHLCTCSNCTPIEVHPGTAQPLLLRNADAATIRSRHGKTSYRITVLPR